MLVVRHLPWSERGRHMSEHTISTCSSHFKTVRHIRHSVLSHAVRHRSHSVAHNIRNLFKRSEARRMAPRRGQRLCRTSPSNCRFSSNGGRCLPILLAGIHAASKPLQRHPGCRSAAFHRQVRFAVGMAPSASDHAHYIPPDPIDKHLKRGVVAPQMRRTRCKLLCSREAEHEHGDRKRPGLCWFAQYSSTFLSSSPWLPSLPAKFGNLRHPSSRPFLQFSVCAGIASRRQT